MSGPKIGCHTLTWGNYYGAYPLKNVLCDIKEAGYEGVEICEGVPNPDLLKSQLKETGLELAALSANVRVASDEKSDISEAMQKVLLGGKFGIKALMVTGGWKNDGLSKDAKSYKLLCRRLDSLCRYASDFGMAVAFHNHLDTIVEDEKDIFNLLEFSRSVKLCVDTGHLAASGCNPAAVIEELSSSVALVHLKDWDPGIKDFVELGRGTLCHNMKNILETLRRINYTNWIIVELDRTSSTPLNSARISRGFLGGIGY
jgi:inosose dehydratase